METKEKVTMGIKTAQREEEIGWMEGFESEVCTTIQGHMQGP